MNQTAYEHAQALAMAPYDFSWWSMLLDPAFVTILEHDHY